MIVLKIILGIIVCQILLILWLAVYYIIPERIGKRIIRKKLLWQEESVKSQVPNMLQTAKHVDIEEVYIAFVPIVSLCLYFPVRAVFNIEGWLPFLVYLLTVNIATLLVFLLYLLSLHIRGAVGRIQGAVLVDPKEKMYYVFPSITSAQYSQYYESELIYTTEEYRMGKTKRTAHIFLTKEDEKLAFKVDGSSHFDGMMPQKSPYAIFFLSNYCFHPMRTVFIAAVLGILLIMVLHKYTPAIVAFYSMF